MKTGKLKKRTIKFVIKNPVGPGTDVLHYAEAGEEVFWGGGTNQGYEDCYGGRIVLWCKLWSGESIGLELEEVEWDEDANQY